MELINALAHSALAQQCVDPPRVDDQTLKGVIDGKAKFLSSLVGDAGLKGHVEIAKTDIFSKYPNSDQVPLQWAMAQGRSRQCACDARRARERHWPPRAGGRCPARGARGKDAPAGAASVGHDAEQSR